MAGFDDARDTGAAAVETVRVRAAEQLASLLGRRPDLVGTAIEVGLVDRAWLDEPGRHAFRTAPALDVVQRFLERSSERQPTLVASLGLNALQILASEHPTRSGDPEPVPVTIVFTDLEGFTRFTAVHGDEAATSLLQSHHREVGPVVRSRGGRVVKRLGDGLMLSFPNPEAGVLASLELIDGSSAGLRMRAGVHTGEAVVTAHDLIGHDVNVAARVADSAKGGQVLATVPVRDAVGDLPRARFGRAKRRTFKGVGHPVSVCPVTVQ